MATESSVNVLDRTTFDNLDPQSKINNIYFVREGSPNNTDMLSLYVGNSKQCDVLDISGLVNIDFTRSDYNIPSEYQIKNKLLFFEQQNNDGNSFYRTFMWNGERFLDCFGIPNNVIVCNSLPTVGTYGYIYIELNTKNIYIYVGGFLKLVSDDMYATNQYVLDVYNTLLTIIDNIQQGGGVSSGECITVIDTARGYAGAVSVNLAGFVDMMQQTWENGSSGSDGTFDGTSSTRIRCQTFIPIPDGTTNIGVVCRGTDSTAWYFEPNLYSSDSESSFVGSSVQKWTYSGTVITPPASSKYIRLVLRNQRSSDISPSSLGLCKIYFY